MSTEAPETTDHRAIDRQLRGSGLLLAGRLLSKFINFGVQVAIIRLLTKDDFGAFAYGLALVAAGEVLVKIGLGQGANRFVPFYFERGEFPQLIGTLYLVVSMIFTFSAAGFAILWWVAAQDFSGFPSGEGKTVVLLIALLAPVQALDQVCVQTLACFSKSGQIFVRKHVVGPLLRVIAVALAYFAGGSTLVLTAAYVAGGLLGLLICAHLVIRELYAHKILPLPFTSWQMPWSQLLGYSLPLISSDLVAITLTGVTTVFLMAMGGESEVATMRAVSPAAVLNLLVVQSFAILYLPNASRLFARNDLQTLSNHHWESVAWVAVLSFPIFALTFGVAPKLVTLLFGNDYASSAPVLAILAIGSFASVAMAFNSETLQVLHNTRALVRSNVLMIVVSVVLTLLLCPTFGALGAACAVTVARILGVTVRQLALVGSQAIDATPANIRSIWLKLFLATGFVATVGWLWQPHLLVQALVLTLGCLWLLRSCAKTLDVTRTFPELLRIPLVRTLVVR